MANLLTIVRIMLTGVFVALAVWLPPEQGGWVLVVFGIAALSDWLDGLWARHTGTVTIFGKILDPIADRLLIVAGVGVVYVRLGGALPLWLLGVVVGRDILMAVGFVWLGMRRQVIPVTWLGKIATATLFGSFAVLLAQVFWPRVWLLDLGLAGAHAGTVLYVGAGFDYLLKGKSMLQKHQGDVPALS